MKKLALIKTKGKRLEAKENSENKISWDTAQKQQL